MGYGEGGVLAVVSRISLIMFRALLYYIEYEHCLSTLNIPLDFNIFIAFSFLKSKATDHNATV